MSIPHYTQVSSLESLTRSVLNDIHTYAWAICLIRQPDVTFRIKQDTSLALLLERLKKLESRSAFLSILLLAILMIMLFHTAAIYLWGSGLLVAAIFVLGRDKRLLVSNIFQRLLETDFDPDRRDRMTLYQVSEYYSETYSLPSLVDTMFRFDNIGGTLLILTFLLVTFVLSLKLWMIVLVMIVCYLLVNRLSLLACLFMIDKRRLFSSHQKG